MRITVVLLSKGPFSKFDGSKMLEISHIKGLVVSKGVVAKLHRLKRRSVCGLRSFGWEYR